MSKGELISLALQRPNLFYKMDYGVSLLSAPLEVKTGVDGSLSWHAEEGGGGKEAKGG